MPRKIKFFLFLILAATVIFYFDYHIRHYDMRFYYGKDDGLFRRFESICALSCLFFGLMSRHKLILNAIIGLFAGVISSILSLIIMNQIDSSFSDLAFHIFSCILFILIFFALEKRMKT